jgi:WD40 repeat protein
MNDLKNRLAKMPPEQRLYTLAELCNHLASARQFDRLKELLTNIFFLEGKVEAGLVFGLANDFRRAFHALPSGEKAQLMFSMLEEALRRDINFIERHPSTLFQCLWNSCWWYDAPDIKEHYVALEGADEPRENVGLYQLLERWLREKSRLHPDFLWVRSHRPPSSSLGLAQQRVFRGHTDTIECVALSNDGTKLVTGSKDGTVRVWDVGSGELLGQARYDESGDPGIPFRAVYDIQFSHDDKQIIACVYDWACVWTSDLSRRLYVVEKQGDSKVRYTPDGKQMFVMQGHAGGRYRCWNAQAELISNHRLKWLNRRTDYNSKYSGFLISPARSFVALSKFNGLSAADKMNVELYSANGDQLHCFPKGESIPEAFSADETLLAIHGDSGHVMIVRDVKSGETVATMRGHGYPIRDASFSPDGRLLATASGDYTVRIWEVRSGKEVNCFNGHEGIVDSVAFSVDGSMVASGSQDRSARLWDCRKKYGAYKIKGHEGTIDFMTFSPDGRRLLTAGDDDALFEWDVKTGRPLRRLEDVVEYQMVHVVEEGRMRRSKKSVSPFFDLSYSRDGKRIIAADNQGVHIWDTRSGKLLNAIKKDAAFETADISPNHTRIVTAEGGVHFNVTVWDAKTVEVVGVVTTDETIADFFDSFHPLVAYSNDGRQILLLMGSNIHAWDAKTLRPVGAWFFGEPPRRILDRCNISRDGTRILVLDLSNGKVRVRDRVTGADLDAERFPQDSSSAPPLLRFGWRLSVSALETEITCSRGRRPSLWFPAAKSFTAPDRDLGVGRAMVQLRTSETADTWAGAVGEYLYIASVERGGHPLNTISKIGGNNPP